MRQPISKGKRFAIFKRDEFTCQYCGEQPPKVVLHVDHITPVVAGGTNEEMNLVTACQACNLGKGRKLLDRPQRPDADLAWLEVQQELAELHRYQVAVQERLAITNQIVSSLQDVWQDYSGLGWAPTDEVIRGWLAKIDPKLVERAIMVTAPKVKAGHITDYAWPKYMWGVMWKMTGENDER